MRTRISIIVVALVALVSIGPLTGTALAVAHNDRVHYVGHLVGTQVFSLCACTANLAQSQYVKGMYHAHTPRQAELLSLRPKQLISDAMRHVIA